MTTATTVNEWNAHRFSDNYAIVRECDGLHVYGCEHNQEEAEAVAKWITGNTGTKAIVVKNGPDAVREAKAIRGDRGPLRCPAREEALVDMGVWAKPKKKGGR